MIDVRLENVTISNFRSFGPVPIATAMASEITANGRAERGGEDGVS